MNPGVITGPTRVSGSVPGSGNVLICIARLVRGGYRVSAGLPINTTRASMWPEIKITHLGYDACPDAQGVARDGSG